MFLHVMATVFIFITDSVCHLLWYRNTLCSFSPMQHNSVCKNTRRALLDILLLLWLIFTVFVFHQVLTFFNGLRYMMKTDVWFATPSLTPDNLTCFWQTILCRSW